MSTVVVTVSCSSKFGSEDLSLVQGEQVWLFSRAVFLCVQQDLRKISDFFEYFGRMCDKRQVTLRVQITVLGNQNKN